jgi:hypothetical protein
LRAGWIAAHLLAAAAFALLGAPWTLKAVALLGLAVHAVARRPEPARRVVYRRDGRIAVPDLGLEGLFLGPRTRFTTLWVRLDLRGAARPLDLLLLASQVDRESWRALQAELRGIRAAAGNEG